MIDKKATGSNACSFFMAVQFLRFNQLIKTLNFVMMKFGEFGTAYNVGDAASGEFDPQTQPEPDYEFDQRVAW